MCFAFISGQLQLQLWANSSFICTGLVLSLLNTEISHCKCDVCPYTNAHVCEWDIQCFIHQFDQSSSRENLSEMRNSHNFTVSTTVTHISVDTVLNPAFTAINRWINLSAEMGMILCHVNGRQAAPGVGHTHTDLMCLILHSYRDQDVLCLSRMLSHILMPSNFSVDGELITSSFLMLFYLHTLQKMTSDLFKVTSGHNSWTLQVHFNLLT